MARPKKNAKKQSKSPQKKNNARITKQKPVTIEVDISKSVAEDYLNEAIEKGAIKVKLGIV